jgi:hypothetical protein
VVEPPDRFTIGGNVQSSVVLQGNYLQNITIQPKSVDDALAILKTLQDQRTKTEQPSIPRQLIPEVLVNRWQELLNMQNFFRDDTQRVFYVFGIAGIGKSSLVRGAVEQRSSGIPLVWINCWGLDIESLLSQLNTGLSLGIQPVLNDPKMPIPKKIQAVLSLIKNPGIVVLDDFQSLLGDDERFLSKEIQYMVEGFCSLEHKLKVIITTRRLPYEVNEAYLGTKILRLEGLSNDASKIHFKKIAEIVGLNENKVNEALETDSFKKIEGHPFFLEMFATSIRDLPVKEVDRELLSASNIGEYVLKQALTGLDIEETKSLQAASIFSHNFELEALNFVYGTFYTNSKLSFTSIRALIRHHLLESITGMENSYYVHPLVRDVILINKKMRGVYHAAAAEWYINKPFKAEELPSWDDTLYHLRKSSEIKSDWESFQKYRNYIFEIRNELIWVGWGRRLLDEETILAGLATDDFEKIAISVAIANTLDILGELNEALDWLKILNSNIREVDNPLLKENIWFYKVIASIKIQLASLLIRTSDGIEAERIASDSEPLVEFIKSDQLSLQYYRLKFDIATQAGKRNLEEMLNWAELYNKIAYKIYQDSPSRNNLHHFAESLTKIASTFLEMGKIDEQFSQKAFFYLIQRLNLLIEIGDLLGIAYSLRDLGNILVLDRSEEGRILGGSFLLTSEQMRLEFGIASVEQEMENFQQFFKNFFSDRKNVEIGSELLKTRYPLALEYYERNLLRRGI